MSPTGGAGEHKFFSGHDIHPVPAVSSNDCHCISGGQPTAVFEQALRLAQPPGAGEGVCYNWPQIVL